MNPRNDDEPVDEARRPRPVSDELRAQVREAHARGLGRNAIARELEVGAGTVTKIARDLGLEFNREETAIATRARQIDLSAIREQLARKFLLAADESLELLDAPVVIGAFGGSSNTWNETLLDGPTIEQRKVLVGTAQAAASKGIELLKIDAENGSVSARGMVAELAKALAKGVEILEAEGGVDPTVTPEQPAGT